MENLPVYIPVLFIIVTVITVLLFYKATNRSTLLITVTLAWLIMQAFISRTGFYTVTNTVPPPFILLILPPLFFIAFAFISSKGRKFIDGLNPRFLTLLHIVRIPVEITLYFLCIQKMVPSVMTFEGRNFDILSGLTAPIIYYFGFIKKQISRKIVLTWNFICLALLINIVVTAVLSAPSLFQQFAFDQPNIALLYFPFIWLPCFIVPAVLFCHLASIRQLLKKNNSLLSH